jgi:hypothetical protein
MPAVAEGSLDEFERLQRAHARRSKDKREARGAEFDSAAAPAPGIEVLSTLPWEPDEKG